MNMDKYNLINDMYDVLCGNTEYCTQEDFMGKHEVVEVDSREYTITIDGKYKLVLTEI